MESFDNDISILLKEAKRLNIPSKFVIFSEGKYSNIINEIHKLVLAGKSLPELYEIFQDISPKDLIMIYSMKEKNSLPKINSFYASLGLDKIKDEGELVLLIKDWGEKIQVEREADENKLENIQAIQEELTQYTALEHSPIKVDSTVVFAQMQMKNGNVPTLEDAYEIFDLSVPKDELPYIRWNTNLHKNKEVVKIYKGKTVEERPDYNKIIPSVTLKETPNTLNLSVLKADTNAYIKSTYNLQTNLLKIKIPVEIDKEKILQNITNSLALDISSINESSISGELYIFDIDINDLLLSHMILNDEAFSNYFFMKEMTTPFALKKQFKLFFRSLSGLALEEDEKPSSAGFTITQNYAKGGEIVNVMKDGSEIEKVLEEKHPYVRINISSADSLKIAEDFVRILSILLARYKEEKDDLEEIYLSFIPEFANYEEISSESKKIGKDVKQSKIGNLKQIAPDLIIPGYARQCLHQPIPISEDEIKMWEKSTFEHKGEILNRQVLSIPLKNPKYHFVCPDEERPFPGLKVNNLENKDVYPGLPCCFKEDRTEKTSKILKGLIQADKTETKPKESEAHTIKSDKILNVGRYGTVPTSVSDLLKTDPSVTEVRRKGVPRSVNSLLHCLSVAIEDQAYLKSKDKEKYVADLRLVIADKIQAALCKQEMYDYTDAEILSSLRDVTSFLDPNLFYRAIEKTYNINLFVFAPSLDEEKRLKNKESSLGSIQMPRFKLFYSRAASPDFPTILIYRTMGSESDNLKYPQCELLLSYEDDMEKSIFDKMPL